MRPLAVLLLFAAQLLAQSPLKTKIPSRTVLRLETLRPFSSATAKVGDRIPLRVKEPLVVDRLVLLPEGALLSVPVVEARRAGKKCRTGRVYLGLDAITLSDSRVLPVEIFGSAFPLPGAPPLQPPATRTPPPIPAATQPREQRSVARKVLSEVGEIAAAPLVIGLWMTVAAYETRCENPEAMASEMERPAGTILLVRVRQPDSPPRGEGPLENNQPLPRPHLK